MQLSGHDGGCRVVFPTVAMACVICCVFDFGCCVGLRCLLVSLAFGVAILPAVVAGSALAFAPATFFVLAFSTVVGVGAVADAERLPATAGCIG